jgi:transcriptional regulator with XRE-family HTH domain
MDGDRNMWQFGELLRGYRTRARLTQQQLADFSTLSVRAIRDLERARTQHPRQDTVRLLAEVLRLSDQHRATFELAGGAGEMNCADLGAERHAPPASLTPIVGRAAETRVLTDLLTVHRHRLVTVVGLAGVGKTRLVQEVARIAHFDAGWSVVWVPVAEPADVRGSAIGSRIGALLADGDEAGELAELIGTRETLLVLDGQETARVPQGLVDLLRRCPGLRVVATALAPSHVPGEHVLPLAPLAVPLSSDEQNLERFAELGAVRMITAQLSGYRPGFALRPENVEVVAGLCRALDGLPKALELAAEWSLVHSLDDLLDQIGRDPGALATPFTEPSARCDLRESLRRTMAVVEPALRQQLAALVRLDRPWSISEAAQVTGAAPGDVAKAVHALLVRGLIRRADAAFSDRFRVLNLVRSIYRDPAGHRLGPVRPQRESSPLPELSAVAN